VETPIGVTSSQAGQHRVTLDGGPRELHCAPGQSVLEAVMAAGVDWLPVGCRGGGCGVCRVVVRAGRYETGRMSRRHIASDDPALIVALSCRLYPTGDLDIAYAPAPRATPSARATGGYLGDR
jgi:ferredoxin